MSQADTSKLYSPQLLALATALADFPYDDGLKHTSEARSRSCGSTIKLGLDIGEGGGISRVGMQVTACAIGQASAAIMAADAVGRDSAALTAMEPQIDAWLAGASGLPEWPGFAALAPAREYAGRHGALLLVWKAARQALSSAGVTS